MRTQRFFTVVCFVLATFVLVAQNSTEKIIFQRYNSDRTVKLNPGTELTVYFNQVVDSQTKDTINPSVYGVLQSLNGGSLQLGVNTEYKNLYYSKDSVREYYVKYSYDNPLSYKTSDINYITYQSKLRPAIEISTVASVVTLLVIAPIFALNLKKGTFNGDAYLNVATPAAFATLITVPFYLNLEDRKVKIKL